jgi:2-methylcitrate dehydratase
MIHVETYDKIVEVTATEEKWSTELSRESADHSLPYVISIAILEGEIRFHHYDADWRQDERVHKLMSKVSVESTDELNKVKEEKPRSKAIRMTVETVDQDFEIQMNYPKGHEKNPVSDAAINEKMEGLCHPHLSDEEIQSAIDTCYNIQNINDVNELIEILRE